MTNIIGQINLAIKYAKEKNLMVARAELENVDNQINIIYQQSRGFDALHVKRRQQIQMVGNRINLALRNINNLKLFTTYLRQAIVLIMRFKLE